MNIAAKKIFTGIAGTALAVTPTATFSQEAANSNDAQVTLASTAAVNILSDADRPANSWVRENPAGIAVSIRLGRETHVPPQTIESVLRQDFANNRFSNLQFFFEQGTGRATSVAYHRRNFVDGPYTLVESRNAVSRIAGQHQFEMANNLN
ncbi:MAG: hypothetical protein Pars2KO_32130 [Parasphingorhabdus sp.]